MTADARKKPRRLPRLSLRSFVLISVAALVSGCASWKTTALHLPLLVEGPKSQSSRVTEFVKLRHVSRRHLRTRDAIDTDERRSFSDPDMEVSIAIDSNGRLDRKLTPRLVRAILDNQQCPASIRHAALRDIYDAGLSQDQHLEFIRRTAEDPDPGMRYMAMLKADEFSALSLVIPTCASALEDPRADVAYVALRPLVQFFDLRDANSGKVVTLFSVGSGSLEMRRRLLGSRVIHVANSIHNIRLDLISRTALRRIVRAR